MRKDQRVLCLVETGQNGLIVTIECSLSNNLPNVVLVGYANKAIDDARELILCAFARSNLSLSRNRITIKTALADISKENSGLGLGIAVAMTHYSEGLPPRVSKYRTRTHPIPGT